MFNGISLFRYNKYYSVSSYTFLNEILVKCLPKCISTPGWSSTVRVKCLTQECNTMSCSHQCVDKGSIPHGNSEEILPGSFLFWSHSMPPTLNAECMSRVDLVIG